MNKIIVPYGRQDINDDDVNTVAKALRSDFLTQGSLHIEFEEAISTKVNSKYCVSVNSATSALHLACLALGLGEGDILWTTPITFVASANCGRYCGAKVDFVDIEERTGLISIEKLEKKLLEASKIDQLPKIVLPVHLAGASCEMSEISRLSKKYGFFIIEDASHALGGTYNQDPVGSCKFSDITVFSLHPVKIITSAEGGLATTNCPTIYEKLKCLRSHGITKDKKKFIGGSFELWRYEQHELGFNFRLSDVNSALGLSQLKRLDQFIQKRNQIAKLYIDELSSLPLNFLLPMQNVISSYHLFIVQLDNKNKEFHESFFNYLISKGIGVQLHYLPVHLQPYYSNMGFLKGQYPIAERYAISSLSLPMFPGLKKQEIQFVINQCKSFFENR